MGPNNDYRFTVRMTLTTQVLSVTGSRRHYLGNWHHVAASYDDTSRVLKLYVNGVQEGTDSAAAGTALFAPHGDVYFGDPSNNSRNFQGAMDEVAYWNRPLSAAEIQNLHQAGRSSMCLPPSPCAELPADAIGWWKGDGTADDELGSLPGTLLNGAGFGSDTDRTFFVLDPLNAQNPEGVLMGPDPVLDAPQWTLLAWAWPYDLGTTPDAEGANILSKEGNPSYLTAAVIGGPGNNDRFRVNVALPGPTNIEVFSANTFSLGHWNFVAGTFDGANLKLYVNGSLEGACGTGGAPGCVAGATAHGSSGRLVIGRHDVNYGSLPRAFHGRIDEPAYFSRALSESEIRAIYGAAGAGMCSFRMSFDQPGGPGTDLWIRNRNGPAGMLYFTAFSADPLNTLLPGSGWWGGLHITVPALFGQYAVGLPPFVGFLDAGGGSTFFLPSLPSLGFPLYGVTHAFSGAGVVEVSAIGSGNL